MVRPTAFAVFMLIISSNFVVNARDEWLLYGVMLERPLVADSRRYLTFFEWRLFLSGLRNRPQLWLKENGTPPVANRHEDQRLHCLFGQTQFWQINSFISSQKASLN
jgi:hypothetical protein